MRELLMAAQLEEEEEVRREFHVFNKQVQAILYVKISA